MRKTLLITAASLLVVFGSAAAWTSINEDEKITGNLPLLNDYIDQNSSDKPVGVESVKWQFEDGETVEGRLVKRNFSPGIYNVTLIVEKTDGSSEKYQKKLKVEK